VAIGGTVVGGRGERVEVEVEVEDHVSPEAENITLASKNPGAENVTD